MVYIEFFDTNSIENICSALISAPEKIVFFGDKMKKMTEQSRIYKEILAERGFDTEIECYSVNKNKISDVIEKITAITEQYDDITFDLTGGDEIFLVAAGIIFERYKDKNIQMHRVNICNNTIKDCDCDGNTLSENDMPDVSVEENIRLYGGTVIYDGDCAQTTPRWDMNEEFIADIDDMWDVCKKNARKWNSQIGVFAKAEEVGYVDEDTGITVVCAETLKKKYAEAGYKYFLNREIIDGLSHAGLLRIKEEKDKLYFNYKNKQVKKCILKAGQVLEMKMYICAMRAEENGEYVYGDVMNGVCIDWQTDQNDDDYDIANEIDVMMMHKMVPVFVSCKNGAVDIDELYKLNTVAKRFGGAYAKRVLIATSIEKNSEYYAYINSRAKLMGIRLVTDIQEMNEHELEKAVSSFWKGC